MANRIQLRRDTTANWNSVDPVLADGEPGYDIVTNELRIGNGSNVWSELSANTISGGGGASTGDVTFSGINIIGDDNLRLQPNVSATDGYIDIYLTTGPDIHIDNSSGNLILGSDSWANVRLATDGNVQIRAQDGGSASTWTFDPDGTLTAPGTITSLSLAVGEAYSATPVLTSVEIEEGLPSRLMRMTGNLSTYGNEIGTGIEILAYRESPANDQVGPTFVLRQSTADSPDSVVAEIYSTVTNVSIGNVSSTLSFSVKNNDAYANTLVVSGTGISVDGNIVLSSNLLGPISASPAPSISGFGSADFSGNVTVGNLLLSAGGQIQSESGTGNVVVEANDGNNVRTWAFETNGNITFPDATAQGTAYQRVTGSWTVTTGSADYSFTVPQNGTYTMWVRGNIPNGIITWNATATVTNNNVPVLGQQFAWNYNAFNPMPLQITALPVQFIGTANTIINANVYGGGPSNTFTFTVNNASGSPQTVYWGYVTQ